MMVYIRKKKIKGKSYYYVVEAKREKNKVQQKVIKYLGSVDHILEVFKFWEEHHQLKNFRAKPKKGALRGNSIINDVFPRNHIA